MHGNINIKSENIKNKINKGEFDPNDTSGMTINGKTFEIKNIKGYSKEVIKLTGHLKQLEQEAESIEMPELKQPNIEQPKLKITGFRGNISENVNPNVNSFNLWETLKTKIEQIKPAIQQFIQSLRGVGTNSKELELVKYKISEIEEKLEKAKNGEIHFNTKQIIEAEAQLERLNNKKQKLEGGNKGNFFSSFFSSLKKVTPSMNNISGITVKIKNTIKQWSGGMKQGLGHVLKYAGALFSLRSIYTTLSSSARSWLSSQNAGAKQLSANIDYLKYSMGSVFAPIIQYVTNLVYNLMKAVQSLVYAFSGVNIFAKATANSMNSASGSASKASKSLSGIHNEINNVSDNDSSGGSGSTSPSVDLSQMDTEMSSLSQKLYNFFKPLVDSWNTYGSGLIEQLKATASQVIELILSVWGSFENIITNGTVYFILENILSIIGNIAEAFSNAWNNNGNGDAIIQNLADAFNNLLSIIEKITQSTVFQWILDVGVVAIEKLTEAVEWVTQKVDEFVGFLTGSEEDLDGWAVLLGSLAIAIGLVTTATTIYKAIKAKETAVLIANAAAWVAANLPIILITAAITAVIAIIVLCIKHWDTIKETVINVCNKIKEVAVSVWNKIKDTISNVVTTIKDKVTTAFTNIKDKITSIMNNVKTTLSNIWNGIWSTIKGVINSIIGGVESMCNTVIRGINKILTPLTKVGNTILEAVGIKSFSFNTIATISLPRLAKGGVLTEATAVVAGEYSGAKSNPEIVTPQNIMRDTFEDVLSDFNGSNGQPLHVTIQYLGKEIFDDTIDYINSKTRRTGKNTIVTVGG